MLLEKAKEKKAKTDLDNPITTKPKKKSPAEHVHSLRDVVDIHFTSSEKSSSSSTPETWICPASGKSILKEAASTKIVYLIPCGHVFAENAYKALNFEKCFVCDEEFDIKYGVVILNPSTQKDIDKLEDRYKRLTEELKLSHSLKPLQSGSKSKKKSKKSKKNKDDEKTKEVDKKRKLVDENIHVKKQKTTVTTIES